MINHQPELGRRLVTDESKWPILTVKPFPNEGSDSEWDKIAFCFKRFYEKSNFEFIMQRWAYTDDELDLNLFFDRFRLEKHTSEFIRDAVGIAKRDRALIESKGQWHLYRLKQEMFYWADYPRGIMDLFRGGSGEFGGWSWLFGPETYDSRAKLYYEPFLKLIIPNYPYDQVTFYANLAIEIIDKNGDSPHIEATIDSRLNNHSIYVTHRKQTWPKANEWLSPWFFPDIFNFSFVVHNQTAKEIVLFLSTNNLGY